MERTMGSRTGITGSALKWIALFSMLLDHSAYILISPVLIDYGITSVADHSPAYMQALIGEGAVGWFYLAYQMMRSIGRLAFPIYCFCLVEGVMKTGNRKQYGCRLAVFAFLSEIPFDLGFFHKLYDPEHQNIFFTLLLGYLMIWGMDILEKKSEKLPGKMWTALLSQAVLFAGVAALAEFTGCDYGAKGILAIALLYEFRFRKAVQILAGCMAFCWEPAALLAFIPIGLYRGKRGKQNKWFFYAFYPVHLLVLYLIAQML